MTILILSLIIIIIAAGFGIYYIILFNKMMTYKSKTEQAEAIIDECLRNKFDLLINTNSLIKNILKSNKNYLKDLTKLKDQKLTNFDLDRKLIENLNIVTKVKQDYSDIDNNKEIKNYFNEFKNIDEKLGAAKIYYNKYTNESNDLCRKFPSNIIASIHKIKVKPFFDGKNMEDDIIDDFKL